MSAVHAASAACRAGSPPEIAPSDAPTSSEIAEVMVTARLPRAAEQPEHEAAEQARVQTGLGRQARERGVADRRRQEVGRQRQAGRDVRDQPRSVVSRQPDTRR